MGPLNGCYRCGVWTEKEQTIMDLQTELRDYNLSGGGVRRIKSMGRKLNTLLKLEQERGE